MRKPIPGVGAIKMTNPGGASDWAQVSAAEVVDDDARYLISVVTLNPMTSGVFMLHDAILMSNCTNANCIYKIDSGVVTPPASGPPVATTAPHVSGSGAVGVALSCDTGTWTNSPTYKFQWKKMQGGNTVLLAGETNSVYTPPSSERGHDIFCTVTATNSFGNASSDSNHVTIVNLATQEQAVVQPQASIGTGMNATGSAVMLQIPLMAGLACSQIGAGGLFLVTYGCMYSETIGGSS